MYRLQALLLTAVLIISSPALAEFPYTTQQLGEDGEFGWFGSTGSTGTFGHRGEPSDLASERNGTDGGRGGDGGSGGGGGDGGYGKWYITGSITLAAGYEIRVGGYDGTNGSSGGSGSVGGSGGNGGFANWPAFAPGQDGGGDGGGQGSQVTGTPGGTASGGSGGGGGGSSGPNGFTQVMSNGGFGYGGSGSDGSNGYHGADGDSQVLTTDSYHTVWDNLQIGGNGANGLSGGRGGDGGGGGGGAGGGGTWPAGLGGAGGSGGRGGSGGAGGTAGYGQLYVVNLFDNHGTIDCSQTSYLLLGDNCEFWNAPDGIIRNFGEFILYGGVLTNDGEIENNGELSNSGSIINTGTITGNLASEGDYAGTGSFIGVLSNTGTVSPGIAGESGAASVSSLDNSGGRILIHLGGTTSDPLTYDQLTVTDDLVIDGSTLELEFVDGFDEADMTLGDVFDIIFYQETFPDEFGEIDDDLAPLTDGLWEVEYQHDHLDGWYSIRLHYVEDTSPVADPNLPAVFSLDGAYPNPFNPLTTISYALPEARAVEFRIYDLAGRQVWTSGTGTIMPAGRHEFAWYGTSQDGHSLPSGSYLLRMSAGDFQANKKLALVR